VRNRPIATVKRARGAFYTVHVQEMDNRRR
jgi:hypothetical protein